MLTIHGHSPNTANPVWYYKDDNDEMVPYGFDEQTALETKWHNFTYGKGDPYEAITCGYFANCTDRYIVDFLHLKQHNVDSNESRTMIRAISNHQINDNSVEIALSKMKPQMAVTEATIAKKYDALKRNLQHEEDCGGDAVTIHIPSIVSEILNDTLYEISATIDIPICAAKVCITGNDKYKTIDSFLNSFACHTDMDIIKLHSMHLKVSSSMISYLISQQKCNFILYDTQFELLAVGKYNGSYIHQYNVESVNPYRYQSFIDFYSLLTCFCQVSLLNDSHIQIMSLISSFNKHMRVCVMYDNDNESARWTPSIPNRQQFKETIQTTQYHINTASVCVSDDDSDDSDDSDDDIECSVCYKRISNPSQCFNHKDLCNSCVLHWKQSGHDSCPKCGVAHIKSYY